MTLTRAPASSKDLCLRSPTVPPPMTTPNRPSSIRIAGYPVVIRSLGSGGLGRARGQSLAAAHAFQRSLALLVEGQDLKLDRQVDLAQRYVVGNLQDRRREVQDRLHARGDKTIARVLRGGRGRRDHADRNLALFRDAIDVAKVFDHHVVDLLPDLGSIDVKNGDDLKATLAEPTIVRGGRGRRDHADRNVALIRDAIDVAKVFDHHVVDLLPDLGSIDVKNGDDLKATLAEPTIVRERTPQVTDADDRAVPIVRQAQLARDLVDQVLDVVADTPLSVRA